MYWLHALENGNKRKWQISIPVQGEVVLQATQEVVYWASWSASNWCRRALEIFASSTFLLNISWHSCFSSRITFSFNLILSNFIPDQLPTKQKKNPKKYIISNKPFTMLNHRSFLYLEIELTFNSWTILGRAQPPKVFHFKNLVGNWIQTKQTNKKLFNKSIFLDKHINH